MVSENIIGISNKDTYKQNRWQESTVVPPSILPRQPIIIWSVETWAKQTEKENIVLHSLKHFSLKV